MLKFAEFLKEEDVKIPNKGDLAEVILACGVAAKFNNPEAVVTRTAIEKMLGRVLSSRKTQLEREDKVNGVYFMEIDIDNKKASILKLIIE